MRALWNKIVGHAIIKFNNSGEIELQKVTNLDVAVMLYGSRYYQKTKLYLASDELVREYYEACLSLDVVINKMKVLYANCSRPKY